MAEKCCFNILIFLFRRMFFIVTRNEGKKKKERKSNMKNKKKKKFKTALFWTFKKKNQHIHFLVHGHFSWSMFDLRLVKGPRTLRMHFFGDRTVEVLP